MHSVHKTPAVNVTAKAPRDLTADLLVIPVPEGNDPTITGDLDRACGGEYGRARQRGEFRGKLFEQLSLSVDKDGWKTTRALLVGAGPRGEFSLERARRIATLAGLVCRQRRLRNIAIAVPAIGDVSSTRAAQAFTEGVTLANYEGMSYKTEEEAAPW